MNLAQRPPRVFVVLRRAAESGAEHELLPYLVTVDAYATEHYTDSGEEVVEGVAMPPEVVTLVADFCETHHVEQPFVKRSEEHTSELQSLMRSSYAAFCLKTKKNIMTLSKAHLGRHRRIHINAR